MTMKSNFYLATVLFILLFGSCTKDLGEFVTTRIQTPTFTQLTQDGSTDIVLTQGPVFSIDFEGYEDILAGLDFRVIRNKLIVSQRGNDWYSGKSTIYITVPDLSLIEITSSGDIYGNNRFRFNSDLDLSTRSSGDLDLYIDAEQVYTATRGSGDIRLRGHADDHTIDLDGSGIVAAFNLLTSHTRIEQTGNGVAELNARNNLWVRLRGSGDIYFLGNAYIDYFITGSGRLIDAN